MGVYPDVSLKNAHNRRVETRKLVASGIDPSENRKAVKTARAERAANSFEVIAREWFAKYRPGWNEAHADRIIRRFERDVFPAIGDKPITEVTAPTLLAVVRKATADRYSASPWRPDARSAILRATFAARCPRLRANTSRQSLTPSALRNCCA